MALALIPFFANGTPIFASGYTNSLKISDHGNNDVWGVDCYNENVTIAVGGVSGKICYVTDYPINPNCKVTLYSGSNIYRQPWNVFGSGTNYSELDGRKYLYVVTNADGIILVPTYQSREDFVREYFNYTPYETKWTIKYIPINCSLTGETSVNPNTNVDVTIAPYPQAEFIGATVYYSGGTIEHTITGNTLSFKTPNISNE